MEKAKEFLEKIAVEGLDRISQLNFPPHRPHIDSSFYEYFVLSGIRVDRVQPGSITSSFKVPHRLTNKDGNLVPGAIATLVDELGAAVIHVEGQPMDVSIDMSINYLSTAKTGFVFSVKKIGWKVEKSLCFCFPYQLSQFCQRFSF